VSTLLSIRLKQRTGALLVGGTLAAVAFLLMLPSVAEAQEEQQEVQQQTISVEGAQPAHEPAERLVVAPGDSLWSISQQRLHPNATTQQISNEAGRIYELNRSRIGDDPNLIFPGQELLAPPAATPTSAAPPATMAVEPAPVAERASEPVEQEPAVLPELPQMEAEPAAYTTSAESSTESYYFIGVERRVLGAAAAGVGAVMTMLALVLAIVKARRTSVKRGVEDPTAGGVPVGGYGRNSENYAHLAEGFGSTAPTSQRDPDAEVENNQELSNAQGGGPRVGFGTNPGDRARSGR
jgi:LysM domain-containing protein